ncbi:MAG: BamA/TamA family outer membrane protein [Acidobacteria bacterium]|nr:BamA/TamA family outer membrane protein [Acidobacteriota bacterium]
MTCRGVLVVALCVITPRVLFAQAAPVIADIRVEQEGRIVDDRAIDGLIETTAGEPLSMREVRETLSHLTGLNRFEDVQVFQEAAGAGVRLRYVLFPLHPVDRMEFRGMLGLPEGDIRRIVTERFGVAPSAGRAAEVAAVISAFYRDRGHTGVEVAPRIEATHNPDRSTMVFDIAAGPRATIGRVEIDEVDGGARRVAPGGIAVRAGDPYDNDAILRELDRHVGVLRARGFYEARAVHTSSFEPDGTATVRMTVDRGPLVSVVFGGDPVPEADRERLVPVRREGSADEDLLEDASFAIEEYLHARGYRDAAVTYTRTEREGELTIAFSVTRGSRYVVETVTINGNTAAPTAGLLELLQVERGEPYVQAAAGAGAAAIRQAYRARGFTRAAVQIAVTPLPRDGEDGPGSVRRVDVRFTVTEGPRTLVGSIAFDGSTVFTEGQLRALMTMAPNRPFSEIDVTSDRDRIDLEYRNRGYESVVIDPAVSFVENGTRADIRFAISEGLQVIVDHVIIVGNQRTSTEIIEREVLLKPGQPLGYSARIETQQRLAALGLFRRVVVDELRHGGEPRRDVLVQLEEAAPTTIGYGGGVEGGTRLRPTGEGGQAEERFEVAPRGFFEVGRRNLWGKNRAVNLFTRVSLRSRDIVLSDSGTRFERPAEGGGYGFNEYRVYATYREPKVFSTPADVLVTGILDQAIRSSFNFITREVRAEMGLRLGRRYSLATRYSYEHTRLFDERFTDAEKPLIDRVFPQVRVSKFSVSAIRDTRNDVIDPDAGVFLIADSELAARAVGSEVGFTKTFLQGFGFYRVPAARRTVLAVGARVGTAHGFRRAVVRLSPGGEPLPAAGGGSIVDVVQDLPASERFFAGGDTTVRGFSLDRLGTDATISPTGFPTGGNGLIVLNAELRAAAIGGFGAVGFIDAGNVFPRASDLDLGQLRAAAGVGLRYQSPVGPIRIDLGFKLDRRELAPGRLERRSVLHISLGQAF